MNLNLNLTLSVIIGKDMTQAQADNAAIIAESLVARFEAKYGRTVAPSVQVASNGNADANKAYLQSQGRNRTPVSTDTELALRSKVETPIDWSNLQSRHEALRALGYDIFDLNRDKVFANGATRGDIGATFNGDVSTEDIPD